MSGPSAAGVAAWMGLSAERDTWLAWVLAAWAEGYRAGRAAGEDAGRREAAAEEAAQRREAAGLVLAGDRRSHAALERARWMLRGEPRTRAAFAAPHPADYPGQGGAA